MRFLLELGCLVFTGVSLSAQSTAASSGMEIISPDTSGCPVAFTAQRWAAGQTELAGHAPQTPPSEDPHGLLLKSFPASGVSRPASLTAVVHGSIPFAHAQPVASSLAGDPHRSQTFHLTAGERTSDGAWKLTASEVPLVDSLDITEVRFADGTRWRTSPHSRCHIVPNGFLLVSAGH